jgi:hypothetical protein
MNSPTTCRPSSCSDLDQALLALRDLVDAAPASTEPGFVSAFQQARMVLRRHEVEHGEDLRRADEIDAAD